MRFKALAVAAAVVPSAFAVLGLAAWMTGTLRLASLGSQYIPMAPSTAIGFLFIGVALAAMALRPGASSGALARGAALLIGTLAALKLLEFFSGATIINIEAAMVARPGSFGNVPMGRMSPVTAAALVCACVALRLLSGGQRRGAVDAGGLLGLAVTLTGSSVALGYIYGAPLLYGGQVIPMALSTGIAFIGAGVSLVAVAGPAALPLRPFFAGSSRARALELLNRDLEERSGIALAAAGAGTWEVDLPGGMMRCSGALGPMFGLPPQPFETTLPQFRDRVHADDRAMVDRQLNDTLNGDRPLRVECRVSGAAGGTRWALIKGRVSRNHRGEASSLAGIAIDVSDRKLLEQQLQQAQRLESLGQLAGSIAHDFNNVLTAILGFCQVLLDQCPPGDRRRDDLSEIQNAGESGQRLSRQLLAFSRRQPIQPALVDLNAVVEGSRRLVAQLMGPAVDVQILCERSIGTVYADAGQIEQVLVNLAVNARDAMPKGGTFRIETSLGNPGLSEAYPLQRAKTYVILSIADTGIGMTPDTASHIFEPFFSTKPRDKGTGLGLATVHGIVHQSGGEISVVTAPGRGTTFTIYLPRVDASDSRAAQVKRQTVAI